MDTEFINIFIAKQKALIDDLQSRLLLSETKVTLLESKLEAATKENQSKKAARKGEE